MAQEPSTSLEKGSGKLLSKCSLSQVGVKYSRKFTQKIQKNMSWTMNMILANFWAVFFWLAQFAWKTRVNLDSWKRIDLYPMSLLQRIRKSLPVIFETMQGEVPIDDQAGSDNLHLLR